ncbi:hypothetical protein CEXT_625961 [Caerostris extrusa]|uniref:Chitin-binding type-2 domain-containing protein n=1 Tax=Caerostris extrusa TaxID=172846 RepID=A0AAV4Y0V1_CAEEX|nr:hypothetical protein CEXT_625961 [Caerostris extrusa]
MVIRDPASSSASSSLLWDFSASVSCVLSGLALSLAASRSKRAAYELPDGAELLVGAVKTSFACANDGYYADIDNNCQIFHVCHTVVKPDGNAEMLQWSFLCGNQTVFNQFSFTCSSYEDAIPCAAARDFFYLNANIGAGPNVPFHNEQDVARGSSCDTWKTSTAFRASTAKTAHQRLREIHKTHIPAPTIHQGLIEDKPCRLTTSSTTISVLTTAISVCVVLLGLLRRERASCAFPLGCLGKMENCTSSFLKL